MNSGLPSFDVRLLDRNTNSWHNEKTEQPTELLCGDGGENDMTIVFVFAVCLAASTVGGICGIGGGVVIKPLLDATGIMSVSTVSFLSGLTVLAMSLISVYKNRKTNELDVRRSVPLGLGAALGGVLGKRLFEMIRQVMGADQIVGVIQAVVLGAMVLATFVYVQNKARIRAKNVQSAAAAALIGLALGMCSSFLGIGGGPMNLAVLYYFFSMHTKQAAVNSILIILISQLTSLGVSLISGSVPAFDVSVLLAMVSAGAIGGFVSARLHKKLSAAVTDKLFSALLVLIFLICCYNALRYL